MRKTKQGSTKGRQGPAPVDLSHLIFSPSKDAELVQAKHRQIIDGACKVMLEKGYHLTTIREIAEACNMSMGQLYHYISCKDDILFLVHMYVQKLWYDQLKNCGVESIKDPIKRLDEVISHTQEFMLQYRKLVQFVATESKFMDRQHLRVVLETDNRNVVGFYRRLLEDIDRQIPLQGDLDFTANLMANLGLFLAIRGWNLKDRPQERNIECLKEAIFQMLGLNVHNTNGTGAKD